MIYKIDILLDLEDEDYDLEWLNKELERHIEDRYGRDTVVLIQSKGREGEVMNLKTFTIFGADGNRTAKIVNGTDCTDGYHTMSELYDHRRALTAALVNTVVSLFGADFDATGKSHLHEDGTMFDGYFIVWIQTSMGLVSYHYGLEYWDQFKCKEFPNAPEYDGHTSQDVIERLLSL